MTRHVQLKDQSGDVLLPLSAKVIEHTWAELKALRDGGELIPGMRYRMTDFVTTTAQSGTKSAGHQYDLVVTALSASELDERASAVPHDGDTYFSQARMGEWTLRYCMDNDTTRFAWADTTNGKGVVYELRDEWGNECGYDFKNILFTLASGTAVGDTTLTADTDLYTFNEGTSGANDASSDQASRVATNNTIGSWYSGSTGARQLNNIVMAGTKEMYNNHIAEFCHDMTFGSCCYDNTIRHSCSNLHAGSYFYSNRIDSYASNITCGKYFCRNVTGAGCSNLTFGNNCQRNTLGAGCTNLTFANNCQNDELGAGCSNLTFGTNCNQIRIGAGCSGLDLSGLKNLTILPGMGDCQTRDTDGNYITLTLSETIGKSYYPRIVGRTSSGTITAMTLS